MEALVVIRDFIIAILLSWIGADAGPDTTPEQDKQKTAGFHLTRSDCDTPTLIRETETEELDASSAIVWFHS